MGTFQTEVLKVFYRVKEIYLEKYQHFTENAKLRRDLTRIQFVEDYFKMDLHKQFEAVEATNYQPLVDKLMFEIIDMTIKLNVLNRYNSTVDLQNVLFWILTDKYDLE